MRPTRFSEDEWTESRIFNFLSKKFLRLKHCKYNIFWTSKTLVTTLVTAYLHKLTIDLFIFVQLGWCRMCKCSCMNSGHGRIGKWAYQAIFKLDWQYFLTHFYSRYRAYLGKPRYIGPMILDWVVLASANSWVWSFAKQEQRKNYPLKGGTFLFWIFPQTVRPLIVKVT